VPIKDQPLMARNHLSWWRMPCPLIELQTYLALLTSRIVETRLFWKIVAYIGMYSELWRKSTMFDWCFLPNRNETLSEKLLKIHAQPVAKTTAQLD